jgi:protease I
MPTVTPRSDGALRGARVAVMMESDYVEPEIAYYERRFAEEGVAIDFVTRMWGQRSLTFTGHEYRAPFEVHASFEDIGDDELATYAALIVPGGMVSDRLRYTEDVNAVAPAAEFLRRAFALPTVLKGIICHGIWLAAPVPETVRGRKVTCHNNLIGDVRNMGAEYVDQHVVVDGDLVTGRSAAHCHFFAREIIDHIAARRAG